MIYSLYLRIYRLENSPAQCGTNIIFFGRMNIRIYSLPYILDKWISEYIRHDRSITNEYPNKFALEKIYKCFGEWIYLSKLFEYIQISDYIPKIVLDNFGNFYILCYFRPMLDNVEPIITIFNNFWETQKILIYLLSSIFDEWISKYIRQYK